MIKKFDVITKLYEEATQEVTESPEKWIAFLQSASGNRRKLAGQSFRKDGNGTLVICEWLGRRSSLQRRV